MKIYTLDLPGIESVNEVMAAVEKRMLRGMELDNRCEDSGVSIATNTRRKLRASIVRDAKILDGLWTLFQDAHMNGECEIQDCPLNDMDALELTERVNEKFAEIREILKRAEKMDQESGDEIAPEPEPVQDIVMGILDTVGRIIGYASPN